MQEPDALGTCKSLSAAWGKFPHILGPLMFGWIWNWLGMAGQSHGPFPAFLSMELAAWVLEICIAQRAAQTVSTLQIDTRKHFGEEGGDRFG